MKIMLGYIPEIPYLCIVMKDQDNTTKQPNTRGNGMTSKQADRWLRSTNSGVRLKWANRMDYTPTADQVQRGLDDESVYVRCAWARRMDYVPTEAQNGVVNND